ncbi:MAG: sensor histidine kinase, partial [Ancrocorticia sp.]
RTRQRDMRVGAGLILGAGLLVLSVATSQNVDWGSFGFALLFGSCAAVALSGMFPRTSATVLAVVYPLVWFTPERTLQLASISIFIVVVMLLWNREHLAAAIFGLWYYLWSVILMIPTSSTSELVTGGFVWAGLLAAFAVVGELLGRQYTANEQLEARRRKELADQRLAIARELHDTVVYSTTIMVMRAEAAKLNVARSPCATTDDSQAEDWAANVSEDLESIANTGRRATADLRAMLAVLRVSESDAAGTPETERFTIPQTSLRQVLREQADKVEKSGLTVQMAVEGDVTTLPEDVTSALAMIVTEACSNMVKHASRSAPATIMIDVQDDAVEGAFVNGLVSARAGRERQGYGLTGLQERAETLGGTVDFSTTESRWIIRVSIPTKR